MITTLMYYLGVSHCFRWSLHGRGRRRYLFIDQCFGFSNRDVNALELHHIHVNTLELNLRMPPNGHQRCWFAVSDNVCRHIAVID